MTIPMSDIVSVNPAVAGTGGTALTLNGVMLTRNTTLPSNTVQSFSSADSVGTFFGIGSDEHALAEKYFLGYDNSTIKPSALFFALFPANALAAKLKSGTKFVFADLKALSGTLTITRNGIAVTSATINLSSANTFSDVATAITTGFASAAPVITATWDAVNAQFIISTAGTGADQTLAFASGSIAAGLKLTQATGAVLSQGADIGDPAFIMDMVKSKTQNWATFMTIWEPGEGDKELFSAWTNNQNQRYAYVAWDSNIVATQSDGTGSLGVTLAGLKSNGTICVYDSAEVAAFVCGMVASIDFSRRNGRITAAFKSQSGLNPTCTDSQIAENLLNNGYNFYGSYATASTVFNFLYNGQISGEYKWIDSYINQIYLNSQLQLSLATLLNSVGSVPYNSDGIASIRLSMLDPINSGINSGIIRTGVELSQNQITALIASAGKDISNDLEQKGWYLQILQPSAQVRGNRGSPVINFWYTDGGAVHKINVASIDVQ